MKLPRTKSEFALFVLIVSVLSVNIIAPLISSFELGFSWATWGQTLKILPVIWLAVVALVLLTNRPATQVTHWLLAKADSFTAYMIINCLVNVLMMSVVLTIVATWIGTHTISWAPITDFFYKWPRNFTISFFVEVGLAQPLARMVLLMKHRRSVA